jgi:hypothetical protein
MYDMPYCTANVCFFWDSVAKLSLRASGTRDSVEEA